jgi:hypothetical protein
MAFAFIEINNPYLTEPGYYKTHSYCNTLIQ